MVCDGQGQETQGRAGRCRHNRYASFRDDLTDRLECGVVLAGTQVKPLRSGNGEIKDGYAQVRDGELWRHNVDIPPTDGQPENHDPDRPRKLLAHKREIERMIGKTEERGLTWCRRASTSEARGRRSRFALGAARTASTSASR